MGDGAGNDRIENGDYQRNAIQHQQHLRALLFVAGQLEANDNGKDGQTDHGNAHDDVENVQPFAVIGIDIPGGYADRGIGHAGQLGDAAEDVQNRAGPEGEENQKLIPLHGGGRLTQHRISGGGGGSGGVLDGSQALGTDGRVVGNEFSAVGTSHGRFLSF